MLDVIQAIVNQLGVTFGLGSLTLICLVIVLFSLIRRGAARHAGLCMALVDKGVLTNANLLEYGAVDDPRHVATLKELLA